MSRRAPSRTSGRRDVSIAAAGVEEPGLVDVADRVGLPEGRDRDDVDPLPLAQQLESALERGACGRRGSLRAPRRHDPRPNPSGDCKQWQLSRGACRPVPGLALRPFDRDSRKVHRRVERDLGLSAGPSRARSPPANRPAAHRRSPPQTPRAGGSARASETCRDARNDLAVVDRRLVRVGSAPPARAPGRARRRRGIAVPPAAPPRALRG